MNRIRTQHVSIRGRIRPNTAAPTEFARLAMLWMVLWHLALCTGPGGAAFGSVIGTDGIVLDAATREKVQAALAKIKESPDDISAVETLVAVEPSVVEFLGYNKVLGSIDPVRNEALTWLQHFQPVESLIASLEKGSDLAVHWALRQIVWQSHNKKFDKKMLERLRPGVELALANPSPATRAQAVRTIMFCVEIKHPEDFYKGMLKGQPDEVVAAVVEIFANYLRESDREVERIVTKWLSTSDNPMLLDAACHYWWLVKGRSSPEVTAEDITAFERLAGHREARVRQSVVLAIEGVATAARPELIAILLRLTHDKDSSVNWHAVRALRNANTPEVNIRLREIFAADDGDLRRWAVEVLGIFGKDNLPLILQAAREDKQPSVRQQAVYCLRMIGTPAAGQGLKAALQDPDAEVKREAQSQWDWFQKEHPAK